MGYLSSLHLIDIKIKAESVPQVERALKTRKGRGLPPPFFLERIVIDTDGFLAFRGSDDESDAYAADEADGTVPALEGKWYEAERMAGWLKQHCERGGRIVLHSIEADGAAWGWEFDGKGRMRELGLVPVGKWA